MSKIFGLFLVVATGYVFGQSVVNRVFLLNHRQFMVDLIQETVRTVEERGWCNLKLTDIEYEIDETIFGRNYSGSVTYKNGFLVSIQHLDVLESSLSQIWNVTNGRATVHVRGQLRMTDVTLGYDIEADMADGTHHYTGTITHPLVSFEFWVIRTLQTQETVIRVFGTLWNSGDIINILPRDPTSDALITLFYVGDTEDGMMAWTEVFRPIAEDILAHRVSFPEMCYNCPVQL